MTEHGRDARARVLAWRALAGIVLVAASAIGPARADEIRFKTPGGVQAGTVVSEDGGTVTVRFPREAIESIRRAAASPEDASKREPAPGLEERVRELERKLDSVLPQGPASPGRQDAGVVEGVIRWKDRPLARGRVMIVPARYAGLSPGPREPEPPGVQGSSGGAGTRYLETETDDGGRYRFDRVPPGEYLLYWMPDADTGWVRRLRDKPDIDLAPGGVAVLNIPEKRK